jgi:hypothetical protein
MLSLREQERERKRRLRGWMIYFLCESRPHPVEFASLRSWLDARNFPLSRRRLAEELDYLRSLRLLRVFPARATKELDEVEQARLIQAYADSEDDGELNDILCARITTAGINFQDGLSNHEGIMRVE